MTKRSWLLVLVFWTHALTPLGAQGVFVEKLRVRRASPLDWQYASDSHGPQPSSERLKKYKVSKQLYDFFGPRRPPSHELPLILFISPGNVPLEWKQFSPVCRRHGVLFAGVRNAGNAQDSVIRIRAAVEVLDDVRRRYRVDPDRTYVAGFSGGAVVASRLAFALPECFGGLLCIGQRVFLPRDGALIDRAGERIDIAALCGGNELVGPEVEHVDRRVADAYGFRCRYFVTRGGGHRMAKPGAIEAAYNWLEDGVATRKELAHKYATTRLDSTRPHDARAWRSSLVDEADARWAAQEYSQALRLLQWIETRWPDMEAATIAASKSQVLEQRPEFVADKSQSEQERRLRIDEALVTGYEQLANDRRAWITSQRRSAYAQQAIRLIEASQSELTDKSQRIEKLNRIVARGDK